MITSSKITVIRAECDHCGFEKRLVDVPEHPLAYLYIHKKLLRGWFLSETNATCPSCTKAFDLIYGKETYAHS